jgi:hypothetical protein
MREVPAEAPPTMPEPVPTVATLVLPLAHVPPPASVSAVVLPMQTLVVPVIAPGSGLTVTVMVEEHPNGGAVYVITDVPAVIPDTTPDEDPTVATPVLPLVHVPPGVMSPSVVVVVAQRPVVPNGAVGGAFTVTTVVAIFPLPMAYVIVVVPADTPYTIPEVLPTVATDVVLLLQLPQVPASVSVVVAPAHALVVPVMAGAGSLMVSELLFHLSPASSEPL